MFSPSLPGTTRLLLAIWQVGLGIKDDVPQRREELHALETHAVVGVCVLCLPEEPLKPLELRVDPPGADDAKARISYFVRRAGQPADPLFPASQSNQLSRDALEHRLAKHVTTATRTAPTLA